MRAKVTLSKLNQFMRELATRTRGPGSVYFTGGSTALLLGIRDQTLDVDIKIEPEPRGVFEAIAALKNEIDINIELASPDNFLPAPSEWRALAKPVATIGALSFFHYDFAMQVLSKIERGFPQDITDATALVDRGLTSIEELEERFAEIDHRLINYPSIQIEEFTARFQDFITSVRRETK